MSFKKYLFDLSTNRTRRTLFDDASALATSPSGGPTERWWFGVILPLIPIGYGIHCLATGHAYLPGNRGGGLMLTGKGALELAVAYMACGVIFHFHYFWGLSDRLWPWADLGKVLSLLVFIIGLWMAIASVWNS